MLVGRRLHRLEQRPQHRLADEGHRADRRHARRGVGAGQDRLPQLAAALRLKVVLLLEEGQQRANLGEEALGDGGVEEEHIHARAADGKQILGVP